jgi:hypothetical protein
VLGGGRYLWVARRRPAPARVLIPAILALLVAIGLVSALLGDGIWDALSWFCLLVPAVAVIYYVCRQTSRRRTV